MKTKNKHKVNATAPRLSDEDIDPIEQEDHEAVATQPIEGWFPWDPEDIIDIRRLIATRMPPKEQFVLDAFLDGLSYHDIQVTEKYWRYHFLKGVEFIKKELKL